MQKKHKHSEHKHHEHHDHKEHDQDSHAGHDHGSAKINRMFWVKSSILIALALFHVALSIAEPSGWLKWTWHYGIWIPIASYVVFWEGRNYFKLYRKLLVRIIDMDTLIGLAGHIIFIYSLVQTFMNLNSPMFSYDAMWEAPIVLFTITNMGHALEERLSKAAVSTYEKLKSMKNSKTFLVTKDGIKEVEAKNVPLGSIILIKRGDLVPLDGIVMTGTGSFDYSNITGESKTIRISKGESVISGAFNLKDSIKIKVTKTYENSTIGKIVTKIETASMTKPRVQKVADGILRWFIPFVLLISITTFVVWLVLGYTNPEMLNFPWLTINSSSHIGVAIEAAVTVLAIACPCALGIATPLIVTVTSMLSMKAGLLINNGNALEGINKIKYFAFDKTGTITTNQLIVSKLHGDKKYIEVAKGLEQEVKHPIGKAILNIKGKIADIKNIKMMEGKGVEGQWNKKTVKLAKFVSDDPKYNSTNTLVALYINNKVALVFELENQIREGVSSTIENLKKMGITPVMITGDANAVAHHIASKVGIQKVYYEVDPVKKSKIIKELQEDKKVAFVGDGFNDSIAMKQADLSIAFATGSDITNSLADISIMSNEFKSINDLLMIGKMNKRRIRLSMTWALMFNLITLPIAVVLLVPPWAGAAIMSSSDIFIVMTGLLYKVSGLKRINKNKDNN